MTLENDHLERLKQLDLHDLKKIHKGFQKSLEALHDELENAKSAYEDISEERQEEEQLKKELLAEIERDEQLEKETDKEMSQELELIRRIRRLGANVLRFDEKINTMIQEIRVCKEREEALNSDYISECYFDAKEKLPEIEMEMLALTEEINRLSDEHIQNKEQLEVMQDEAVHIRQASEDIDHDEDIHMRLFSNMKKEIEVLQKFVARSKENLGVDEETNNS